MVADRSGASTTLQAPDILRPESTNSLAGSVQESPCSDSCNDEQHCDGSSPEAIGASLVPALGRRARVGDNGANGEAEDGGAESTSSESGEACAAADASNVHLYDSFDESNSEGSFSSRRQGAQLLLRRGRRTTQHLQQRAQHLVQDLKRREEMLQKRGKKIGQLVQREVRQTWLLQQERLVTRSREMTRRLLTGRSRAWRHKWIFALVQADFVASAFWLGRSPETYYMYFTAQICSVLTLKAVDYRVTEQHYFLLDYCFFANLCVLAWLWLCPTSGAAFNAAEGVCGLLSISVVVFRNSCVPHDFVRISNAYVHYPAVVTMLSVKMKCTGDHCMGIEAGRAMLRHLRLRDAWLAYISWAVIYASIIFLLARKRIARKQRDTLYGYFAEKLGFKEKLPKWLRPYSQVIFMLCHQTMFLAGVWWIFLPLWGQCFCTVLALTVFFHNGGRFYVDHFWKAHERNTAQYVDAARLAMCQGDPPLDTAGLNGNGGSATKPSGEVAPAIQELGG